MSNPVVWFEILGKDGEKLRKFYGETFGWTFDTNNPIKYGLTNTGSEKGICGGVATGETGMGWAIFYIEVEDVKTSLKNIEDAGGRIVVPYTEIPDMANFAVFADPDGNKVGLVQRMPE